MGKLLKSSAGKFNRQAGGKLTTGGAGDPCCCKRCVYEFIWVRTGSGESCGWALDQSTAVCTDVLPPNNRRDRHIRIGDTIHWWHVGEECSGDEDCTDLTPPADPDPNDFPCDSPRCYYTLTATCVPGDNDSTFVITSITKACLDDAPAGYDGRWHADGNTATLIVQGPLCDGVEDCPDLTAVGQRVGDQVRGNGLPDGCQPCVASCLEWPSPALMRWTLAYTMDRTGENCQSPSHVEQTYYSWEYPRLISPGCEVTWAFFGIAGITIYFYPTAPHPWHFSWGYPTDAMDVDGDCAGFTATRTTYNPFRDCTTIETWTFVIET